jgi:1-acyl-sn-glycerol-3-phosphate acyltransferase
MTTPGFIYPPLPVEVLERAIDVARSYDPQARGWPTLMWVFRLYRLLGVGRMRILGRENLVVGPRIVVANHARVSDAFLMSYAIGRFQALAQVESLTLRWLGPLLARAGMIPVIPGRGGETLALAEEVLRRGGTILIYPEGRLSHGGPMSRGRTGAARLALASGAPIQPVAVYVHPKHVRQVHGHFYGRPTVGMWQVGGPTTILIGEAWHPFPAGSQIDVADARRATDEIIERVEDLVSLARLASA